MRSGPTPRTSAFQFGTFVLDAAVGELYKAGIKIRLQDQSLHLLAAMLERPGEVITREELRKQLWPDDTFVDFEHSLNAAIKRLRDTLDDSAEQPRFIETVHRRGYRWIAPVLSQPGSRSVPGDGSAPAVPIAKPPNPHRWSRVSTLWAALALLPLFLGAILAWSITRRNARMDSSVNSIHSLAVLPLENLSADPSQDYFADGITDELITMLAKNTRLRVISRTSVMQYKKAHRPLRDIARELGVDGIVEGAVARSGRRVRVNAQLIHAATDSHVWAESYDRDLNDVDLLPAELAQTIARQVGLAVSVSNKPERRISPEAHAAYLMGRYYWFASSGEKSRPYFQKAIDLQPDWAAAWSGLADSFMDSAVSGTSPAKAFLVQGEEAARKAVALDDSLPEAHNSLAAFYFFYLWDWKRAEQESARVLELNPNFAEGHHLRGYVMGTLNRSEEDLQEQRKSMELDPFARPWAVGRALIRARQFDAALNEARLRSVAQPNDMDLHFLLRDAYWHKGMEKESAQEWERALLLAGEVGSATAVRQVFGRGGYKAVLQWQLSDLGKKATRQYTSPLDFADIYAHLKRKDEAIRYLEQAYEEHAPGLVHIQGDPNLDFLHSDPRYEAILNKMGLPGGLNTKR